MTLDPNLASVIYASALLVTALSSFIGAILSYQNRAKIVEVKSNVADVKDHVAEVHELVNDLPTQLARAREEGRQVGMLEGAAAEKVKASKV